MFDNDTHIADEYERKEHNDDVDPGRSESDRLMNILMSSVVVGGGVGVGAQTAKSASNRLRRHVQIRSHPQQRRRRQRAYLFDVTGVRVRRACVHVYVYVCARVTAVCGMRFTNRFQ